MRRFLAILLLCLSWTMPVQAMQAFIPLNTDDTPLNSTVEYVGLSGGGFSATLADRQNVAPMDFVVTSFRAVIDVAPVGALELFTFQLMDGGDAVAGTCVIQDTDTECTMSTPYAYANQDLMAIRSTPSGTPSTDDVNFYVEYWTADGSQLFLGHSAGTNLTNNATHFISPQASNASNTDEFLREMLFPTSGVLHRLTVHVFGDPGTSPNDYDFTTRIDSVNGNQTVRLDTADETAQDTTNVDVIATGSALTLEIVPNSTPTAIPASYSLVFTPDVYGEYIWCAMTTGLDIDTNRFTTVYNGAASWSSTQTSRHLAVPLVMVKRMQVELSAQPGSGGDGWDFFLVDDTTNTAMTTKVINTATTDSFELNLVVSANSLISTASEFLVSPAASINAHIAYLLYSQTRPKVTRY